MTKKINEGFGTSQVAVTSAASKIVTGHAGTDTVTLYNTGTATAYVGAGSGVTATTGFPIPSGGALVMEATVDIYALTASGSTTLAILVEA